MDAAVSTGMSISFASRATSSSEIDATWLEPIEQRPGGERLDSLRRRRADDPGEVEPVPSWSRR